METGRRSGKPGRFATSVVAGVLIAAALASSALCAVGASTEPALSVGADNGFDVKPPNYVSLTDLVPSALPVGTAVVTEGMYGGRVEDTLALRGSPVLFALPPAVAAGFIMKDMDAAAFVRVEGMVAYSEDSKTYYIQVDHIRLMPNPREKILAAINDPQATHNSLVQAGNMARLRAKDYDDERLEILVQAAFIKALKLSDLAIRPGDYDSYLALAEESYRLLERPALREYYIRQGVDAYLMAKGRTSPATFYEAARMAAELLPEGALGDQLVEDGFRLEWNRGNFSSKDYYALATKAKEILGDGPHHQRFVIKALDSERQSLPAGDYNALFGLARKAKEDYPGYPNYRSIVQEAITLEKGAMDAADPQAWVRLGNRILYFLDDAYQAGICFREAARIDAGNVEAREKLRELGYVFYQGRWWRSEELGRSEVLRRVQALDELARQGKVAVGMSKEQVLAAKGFPESIHVSAGGWGVTTQWVYRDQGLLTYVDMIADVVVLQGEAEE